MTESGRVAVGGDSLRARRLLQLAAGELWSGLPSMAASETFHHYRILKKEDESLWELGRGGMGVTFKALDTRLECVVALKVINPTYLSSETARERFQREARAAASLRHANVPWVSYLGCEGGEYFYAMEFIEGETAEALVKRQGPLDAGLAARIVLQVADALGAAQKVGLVHRDIKPSNLMLVRQEEEIVVKLIDFGLAKFVEREMDLSLTQGLLGTPLFASPEQLHGEEVDVRSDIYSLGVTLWYLLTGTTPFSGSLPQVINQHLNAVPDLGRLMGQPPELIGIISRMLAKQPADRPQTPQALRLELKQCLRAIDPTPPREPGNPSDAPQQHDTPSISLDEIGAPPAVGMLVAGRYRLVDRICEDVSGVSFRAEDVEQRCPVAVRVLAPGLLSTPQARVAFENDATRAQAAGHANLTRLISFAAAGKTPFLVQEWLSGFSLVELLRSRRELPLAETLLILEQMAAAIDHALATGLARLDVELSRITIHFPAGLDAGARERRLRTALTEWPPFLVKLDSCAMHADAMDGATWSGNLTLVPGGISTVPSGEDVRTRYLRRAAIVCCELLGARASLPQAGEAPSRVRAFSPTPTVSEWGNEVLKRCLTEPSTFRNAQAFVAALKAGDDRAALASARLPPHRPDVGMQARAGVTKQHGQWRWAMAATVIVAALCLFSIKNAPIFVKTDKNLAPAPESPGTPIPSTEPTPAPPPPKAFPGASPVEQEVQRVVTLRTNPTPPLPPRPPTEEASPLDTAIALLIGNGVSRDEAAAVEMLKKIVRSSGDPKAMEVLGRCYLEGTGAPQDFAEAYRHLDAAVAKDHHDARVGLAKLYMEGLGVPKNSLIAASLLREGAEKNNPACMYNFSLCLKTGAGVERDLSAAEHWFKKSESADGQREPQ